MRRGWGAEQSSGANKEWRFYSKEEEQTKLNIRSKTVGCDDLSGQAATNSKSISSDERKFRNSKEESREERKIRSKVGRIDSNNAPNSNSEGSQGHGVSTNMETMQISEEHIAETDTEEQQTWWQTQSAICGVPNGVSFELDKDRKDRIKSLGNSIVPLIARQLGLAIMKAELDG